MKYLNMLPAALVLLAAASGCTSTAPPPARTKMAFGVPDGTVKYQKVSPRNLSLKMVGKPVAYAGEQTALTYVIANSGSNSISIPEWYSNESDNLVILAQPWLTGMKGPDPDSWIELVFELKKPIFHHPLILMPGNQVMISKELPFVEKIRKISPGMERRYFIKAKSNLKSLTLESEITVLKVLPRKKTGEK